MNFQKEKRKKEPHLKSKYVLAHSLSLSPTKTNKQTNKQKEFFTFKKSNTILFPPFQAVFKPETFVAVAFQ